MASRSTAERPPKHPGMTLAGQNTGGSYVERFKIQKERIKTLHQDNDKTDKTLPKISQPVHKAPRDNNAIKKFMRSNTLVDRMKLPGVSSGSTYAQAARRREPVPLKTFHMRLNPEHSNLSRSLPSLPSIPGSPPHDHGVSPLSERNHGFKASTGTGKHWYQKIAFQKTLHQGDKLSGSVSARSGKDYPSKDIDTLENIYNNVMPRRAHRHKIHGSNESLDTVKDDFPPKSNSTLSHARFRRPSRESGISETRSEGNYFMAKKWKDNCDCLRWQMLKREYKEGDEHYKLWGQYPCHKVENNMRLDDDN